MVKNLDPRNYHLQGLCYVKGEEILIENAIKRLLQLLYYIINVNEKDNFYNRYLVMKGAAEMQPLMNPLRRSNYEEMVLGNIGKQFVYNEHTHQHHTEIQYLNNYKPTVSLNSKFQTPLPLSINVHNYYNGDNIGVNLIVLKMIINTMKKGDRNLFNHMVLPTEHIVFENQFLVPLKLIIDSIELISNTKIYKEYVFKQRFGLK